LYDTEDSIGVDTFQIEKLQAKEFSMRGKTGWFALAICVLTVLIAGSAPAQEAKITVMNPRGIQPEIRKIPMAKRPATLDGRTVYIVDTKYPNTKPFVNELFAALKAKYPKTTWILRDKAAGYMDDDPNLWKEIKGKDAAAIVLLGH